MMEIQTDLKRTTHDRWFMGVCGGIAHEYGWNPKMVRLAAIVLALALPGPGTLLVPLAYVIFGIVLPKSEEFQHSTEKEVMELLSWHDGWSWWWPGMIIETMVFYGLVVWALVALVRFFSAPERRGSVLISRRTTAETILAECFARGEIDSEEYTRRLAVLRSPEQTAERRNEQVTATRDPEPAGTQ